MLQTAGANYDGDAWRPPQAEVGREAEPKLEAGLRLRASAPGASGAGPQEWPLGAPSAVSQDGGRKSPPALTENGSGRTLPHFP